MLPLSTLASEHYALSMSPGFFMFYAQMGVLHALEDSAMLQRISHVSGSSAGAMVTGFLAAGVSPSEMRSIVFEIKREDIWDIGGFGGLLKGQLFQALLEKNLPIRNFEDCRIPLGITAWNLYRFRTSIIHTGDIATAIRASCCFPILFAPVTIDGSPHIDGGVFDNSGLMALPGIPESKLIVNVVCGRNRLPSSVVPDRFKGSRLLTLVLDNIPRVDPFSMTEKGPAAYATAYAVTRRAIVNDVTSRYGDNHWVVYLDGAGISPPLHIPVANIGAFTNNDVGAAKTDTSDTKAPIFLAKRAKSKRKRLTTRSSNSSKKKKKHRE